MAAREFKQLYSLYQQNRDLISVGAYEQGSDEQIDLAIRAMPSLLAFLQQSMDMPVDLEQSLGQLMEMFPPAPPMSNEQVI